MVVINLRNSIKLQLERLKLTKNNQHGILEGRMCLTNLNEYLMRVNEGMYNCVNVS